MACETGPRGAGEPAPSTLAPPPSPRVAPPAEWEAALAAPRRALAAKRRRMPMTPVARDHRVRMEAGKVGLPDLSRGRRRPLTCEVLGAPGVEVWPEGDGTGCPMPACGPAPLAARDAALVPVPAAPPRRIAARQRRRGWDLPWMGEVGASVSDGVAERFGADVVLREVGRASRARVLGGPPVAAAGSPRAPLGLTPRGRRQADEDSPPGWPQGGPSRDRLHDAHGPAAGARA